MEKNLEKWQVLCAQAAIERDPERLMALVREIARLLDEKHDRLEEARAVGESLVPRRALA